MAEAANDIGTSVWVSKNNGENGFTHQAPDSWEILASNNGTSWTSILQSLQDGYRLTANVTGGWAWASPDVFYDATDRNINIGPINSTLGVDSISIGYYAGQIDSSGSREASIFIGTRSGQNTIPTTTDQSKQFDNAVMIGHQAGMNSIYMEKCCAIGSNAAASVENNPHSNSNYFGFEAGHDSGSSATGGFSYSNGFFGTYAVKNYVGIESQGFGRDALYTYQKSTTMRYRNNAINSTSMRNAIGDDNCGQGSGTMRWDSGGTCALSRNVAIGSEAMGKLTNSGCQNSNENVFIGHHSGRQLSGNAVGNTCVGQKTMYQGVGSKNICLGNRAGEQHNGSNCIYLGENVGLQQAESNKLRIGTIQNQQLIVGTMGSTLAASILQLNCSHLELSRTDLPTAYDAAFPNRIWVDGAGTTTGSNISGVLRIGAVNTQYDSGTGAHNNVLQCANSNSSIFAFTHTSKNRTQNNKHNLTIVTNSNAEFVYTFDVKPTHAYYIITAQHENTQSVNSQTDLNSYITNKSVNSFTLTFRQGDNDTPQDNPMLLVDHSVSIMGVSANQIDTTSQTIPQLRQTNVFPTGFNLA